MIRAIKNNYHLTKAVAANMLYAFPGKKLKIVAVTGTDGKTTTVNLIYHILRTAGIKVGMLSTIGAYINGKEYDTGFHVTTPSSFLLQKLLKEGVKKGLEYFVLEVTSHGIDQNRVWGIPVSIGVLTNVTEEHLDYHGTYEKYLQTKLRLFENCKVKVINHDDRSYPEVLKKYTDGIITYGLDNRSDINPSRIHITSPLEGEFNMYNTLAAVAVAQSVGIDDHIIQEAIASFEVPRGRQNVVYDKDFTVMIDFAHTPNSLQQILKNMRNQTKGRLIHVFGSAGERDVYKRPHMGRISSEYTDVIILTAEDPRSEPVEKIMSEIEAGISDFQYSMFNNTFQFSENKKYVFKIPDRQQAIQAAIQLARPGDTVLLTGKGHEKSMNFGKGEVEWDEYKAVDQALKMKGGY